MEGLDEWTRFSYPFGMPQPWPMVGRRQELKAAKEAVARTGALVLAGRPGVGKTRLAQELLKDRRSHGWETAWVVGTASGARIPFGAFAPLLPILNTKA